MAQPRNKLGYAKLAPYQYQTFSPQSLQYTCTPVFSQPPTPPVLEPPTNHPVDLPDDDEEDKKDKDPPVEGDGQDGAPGEHSSRNRVLRYSLTDEFIEDNSGDAPADTPEEGTPGDGDAAAAAEDAPANPDELPEHPTEDSNPESAGDGNEASPEPATDGTDDKAEGSEPKEVEFDPIDPTGGTETGGGGAATDEAPPSVSL